MAISADEFLQQAPGATPSPGATSPVPQTRDEELELAGSKAEPQFDISLTPSGIEVLYQWAPKRLYRVRRTAPAAGYPEHDWAEVASVTTILGVLDKPALPWWGMKTGVEGALALAERGLLRVQAGADGEIRAWIPGKGLMGSTLVPADVKGVVELLNEFKMTVNHVRDKAGDRGNSVHRALENFIENGVMPQPVLYPENERGYVEGLIAFLRDLMAGEPELETAKCEVTVGSIEHRFAGRYDLRLITRKPCELVTRIFPKAAPKTHLFAPGSRLWDLKTSAGVFETHQMQLEAYENAGIECGYEQTDERIVVRVSDDGRYEAVKSKATFDDFLAVKSASDALESLKRRRK